MEFDPVAKIPIFIRDGLVIIGHELIDDEISVGFLAVHSGLTRSTPLVLRCVGGHDLVLNGGGNRKIDQQCSIHSVSSDPIVVHAVVAQRLGLQPAARIVFDQHIGHSLVLHANGDFQLIYCSCPAQLDILKDGGGIEAAQLAQCVCVPGG